MTDNTDKKPLFEVPTIREYFLDLEYVLSVISDGPTKSVAYRRLQYLTSKFEMYHLLNEFHEMAEMKVRVSFRFRRICAHEMLIEGVSSVSGKKLLKTE